MTWVDAHCHLDHMDRQPESVVAEARAAGVVRMITVGVDLDSSRVSIELAERFSGVDATAGVHPNNSSAYGVDHEVTLEELARSPAVVGVGEAGLDYYRQGAPKEDQERSFRSQLRLARNLGKALVVHTRDAHPDTKRVLAEEGPLERLVMHCFSGDERDAADYLDMGAVLSFAGNVTFGSARLLRRAAFACPLDRMLVETDAPFLSPHPYRGRANSPARLPVTGRFLAELKGVSEDDFAALVAHTADRVFGSRLGTGRPA